MAGAPQKSAMARTGQAPAGVRPHGPGANPAMLAAAPSSASAERVQIVTTDKAAGLIVVGCIAFLAGLRVAFKGHVI